MNRTAVNVLAVVGVIALVGGAIAWFGKRIVAGIGIGTPMLKNWRILYGTTSGAPIGVTGKLFLPIKNQNAFSIPTPRFDGNILYQGRFPLANVIINDPVTLQAGEQTTLVANVNIDFENLGESVASIVRAGLSLPSFWLKGELTAANVHIPVNQNIQII